MPKIKQGALRKKKRTHMMKESPFPVPIRPSVGEAAGMWYYYTGYIEGSAVVIKHSGDMDFLYKMGFFGKGSLSRSQPDFHERARRVDVRMKQKDGHWKAVQPVVMNKRSYLVHKRYKALAEGQTAEYKNIVFHEGQQQGIADSSDVEKSNSNSEDDSPEPGIDMDRLEAFQLLKQNTNSVGEITQASATSGENVSDPPATNRNIQPHLMSMLAEVSVLSNEQITSFMRVPQDMKELAVKYTRMRAAQLNMLNQMVAARFPGRKFRQEEIITLDEDDSSMGGKHFENDTENAVVISDSDEAEGNDNGKTLFKKIGQHELKSLQQKGEVSESVDGGQMNSKVVESKKPDSPGWAGDDSNFWSSGIPDHTKSKNNAKQEGPGEAVTESTDSKSAVKKDNDAPTCSNSDPSKNEKTVKISNPKQGKEADKTKNSNPEQGKKLQEVKMSNTDISKESEELVFSHIEDDKEAGEAKTSVPAISRKSEELTCSHVEDGKEAEEFQSSITKDSKGTEEVKSLNGEEGKKATEDKSSHPDQEKLTEAAKSGPEKRSAFEEAEGFHHEEEMEIEENEDAIPIKENKDHISIEENKDPKPEQRHEAAEAEIFIPEQKRETEEMKNEQEKEVNEVECSNPKKPRTFKGDNVAVNGIEECTMNRSPPLAHNSGDYRIEAKTLQESILAHEETLSNGHEKNSKQKQSSSVCDVQATETIVENDLKADDRSCTAEPTAGNIIDCKKDKVNNIDKIDTNIESSSCMSQKLEGIEEMLKSTNQDNLSSPLLAVQQADVLPKPQDDKPTDKNDKLMIQQDDDATVLDNDSSDDSDDVICIESQSAEPKKLHTFLSQTTQKAPFPVVTKAVTFMSNITEEPTYVRASVGFHSWNSILHFNFTGDPAHLPTVMSVSLTPSVIESQSQSGPPKTPHAAYERIYPPVRSLIPNANSTGAVIKQRLRGLPCLTAAYMKLSQAQKALSPRGPSNNKITNQQQNSSREVTIVSTSKSPSKFPFNPSCPAHSKSVLTSSDSKTLAHPLQVHSETSSSNHKIHLFHLHSYIKAFDQASDPTNPSITNNAESNSTDINKPINTVLASLSTLLIRIEAFLYPKFSKDKVDVKEDNAECEDKRDLIEFHKHTSEYMSLVGISSLVELQLLKLLLSEGGNHTEAIGHAVLKVKKNFTPFQNWMLRQRFQHCKENIQTESGHLAQKNVIIDLTASSGLEMNISDSDGESNMVCSSGTSGPSGKEKEADMLQISESAIACEVLSEKPAAGEDSSRQMNHCKESLQTENRKRKCEILDGPIEDNLKKLKSDEENLLNYVDSDEKSHLQDTGESQKHPLLDEGLDIDGGLTNSEERSENNVRAKEDVLMDETQPDSWDTGTGNIDLTVISGCLLQEKPAANNSGFVPKVNAENSKDTNGDEKKASEIGKTPAKEISECATNSKDLLCNADLTQREAINNEALVSSSCLDSTVSVTNSDSLDKKDNQIDTRFPGLRNGESSATSTIENQNIVNPNSNLELKTEQKNIIDVTGNVSLKDQTFNNFSEELNMIKKLENDQNASKSHLMKSETNQAVSQSGSLDISRSDREKMFDNEAITETTITNPNERPCPNVISKLNESTQIQGDTKEKAGNSEDFQICIGSSSDEAEEVDLRNHNPRQSASTNLHPYSIVDDSDGDLFVVANTSDDEDDDSVDEVECEDEDDETFPKREKQKWRSCVKKDPYPTEETLSLMLEEAFFLSFGLSCLRILDPEMKLLDLTQIWQQFQVLKEQFIPHYVAYHYFRSKGWVPKSGLKFGCDLILYREGPPFSHGSYSVVVTAVRDNATLPSNLSNGSGLDLRKLNWLSLAGLNRITEHVAKELMLCYVIWPGDLTAEESLSPECISRFKVKEVVVSRWVSAQERENKYGEEEIP